MAALDERTIHQGRGSEAGPAPKAGERPVPRPEEPALSELEFTGCTAVPMTWEEFRRFEGRLEFWDAKARTAWMVSEPTSPAHENPSHGLAGLVERIGAVRGAPIKCFGSMDLLARRLLASRGMSGTGPRLDAADLRGVADEDIVDTLLRSEDEADFRTRLARLRKVSRAREPGGS